MEVTDFNKKLCFTGGSGAGSAAAGGLGQTTRLSGPAPAYGSLYFPHEYGGNGGTGGGAQVDSRCLPYVSIILLQFSRIIFFSLISINVIPSHI